MATHHKQRLISGRDRQRLLGIACLLWETIALPSGIMSSSACDISTMQRGYGRAARSAGRAAAAVRGARSAAPGAGAAAAPVPQPDPRPVPAGPPQPGVQPDRWAGSGSEARVHFEHRGAVSEFARGAGHWLLWQCRSAHVSGLCAFGCCEVTGLHTFEQPAPLTAHSSCKHILVLSLLLWQA